MNCPICKTDITEPIKQFGGRIPVCQSCWNNGDEWAVDDAYILNELEHGLTLQEACDKYAGEFQPEKDEGFINFMWQICLALESK